MKTYYKIRPHENSWIILDFDNLMMLVKDLELDEKYEIVKVPMAEKDYNNLKESEGW